MKKLIYIAVFLLLIISCTTPKPEKFATIEGKIISGNIEQVEFQWIKENPINSKGELYRAKVDSYLNFSIKIPVERMATGRISSGAFYHEICLLPGDHFNISIDGDSINYEGKGAAKNNFLYALEKRGLWAQALHMQSYKEEFSLAEYLDLVKDISAKRIAFLDSFPDKSKLEDRFVEFYKIDNQVLCETLIQNYPRLYGYKNRVDIDTIQFPAEYAQMNQISKIMDDRKIIAPEYLHLILGALNKNAEEIRKTDKSLDHSEVRFAILLDSLQGKTKEYALAQYICDRLSYRDEYDSLAMNIFIDMNHDLVSGKVVKSAKVKFGEKHALIGQALHNEFAETQLLDTANVELTFSEMMSKYKGNVVYVDMWSLGCGPCRIAMPHSKKLKDKLAHEAIKFIYITVDDNSDKVCKDLFEVSLTKENHYFFKNGFNSRLHDFMGINWVPNYMIFDKKGQLVDYNADRPVAEDENGTSSLEKELIKLAKE